jgi:hypothetical protein
MASVLLTEVGACHAILPTYPMTPHKAIQEWLRVWGRVRRQNEAGYHLERVAKLGRGLLPHNDKPGEIRALSSAETSESALRGVGPVSL